MIGNSVKTILITGINGFLGSQLAKTLCEDYKIVGLESSVEDLSRLKDHSFEVYSSENKMAKIFEENDFFAVIHAATIYRRSDALMEDLISTNILLPVKLYELANRFKAALFFNTDSFFNNDKYHYSYLPDYTLSKKHILEWLKLMKGRCKLINMKVFHMYGPGDSPNKFIPQIMLQLKSNEPYINATLGEQKRDFIYAADVVSAYKIVLEKAPSLMGNFLEFEVGTGKETSVKEFILKMKELMNSSVEVNFGALNYRSNEIMESKAQNHALCDLGWRAKYNICEGISDLLHKDEL